jgi:hypothetical protein
MVAIESERVSLFKSSGKNRMAMHDCEANQQGLEEESLFEHVSRRREWLVFTLSVGETFGLLLLLLHLHTLPGASYGCW